MEHGRVELDIDDLTKSALKKMEDHAIKRGS